MLTFSPLYWVIHDSWKYEESFLTEDGLGNEVVIKQEYFHAGHVHFFMMDYNSLKKASQQAYTGSQKYSFKVEDVWGPNSTDPNQTKSYKLIGKPRWYFYIEEYWRRIYIQPWDVLDYEEKNPNHPDRIGIKYDASLPQHSLGPFREGGGLYFFDTEVNRTLPVEYWLDADKTQRQHVLRKQHYEWDETLGGEVWSFEKEKREWNRHGRGYYWGGDNAYYNPKDYYEYLGYNKFGDVVKVTKGEEKKYYKYGLIASVPTATAGQNYWPNPTPGAELATLRQEYLTYYDFTSFYGDRYTNEYKNWLDGRPDNQENFDAFISTKAEEFQQNCLSSDMQTIVYEYVGFEDYCLLWEELSRKELIRLGIFGSYPLLKDGVTLPITDSNFGPKDDPFHKNGQEVNPYDVYKKYFENREEYTIPRKSLAEGDMALKSDAHPRERSYSDEDGARRYYSDNLYIHPVIEYQKVVHLNYERLPESKAAEANVDIWTDVSGQFGEGFEVDINIPFKINGFIQSPFSNDNGVVSPPGNYFHGFDESKKMVYNLESYGVPINIEMKPEVISNALSRAQKYDRSNYTKFMNGNPSLQDQINWFNENYADRPIIMNPEEGMFDENSVWIELMTQERPHAGQVNFDNQGKPTMKPKVVQFNNPGYKEDGLWVEQCLGAKVIPKIELVFEDALGHRFTKWVDSMEAKSSQPFTGMSNDT